MSSLPNHVPAVLLAVLLTACGGTSTDPSSDAPGSEEAPDDTDAVDPLALPRDAEAEEAVAGFLADVAVVSLDDVSSIVSMVHAESTDSCPAWRSVSRGQMFSEGCTTDAGVVYNGTFIEAELGFPEWMDAWVVDDPFIAGLATHTDDVLPGGWASAGGMALDAAFDLTIPGLPLQMLSGVFLDIDAVKPGFTVRVHQLTGPVQPSTLPGIPNLTHAVLDGELGTVRRVEGTLADADGSAVYADLLLFDPAVSIDGRCVDEPEGTVGLRDASGAWRDLVFDAAEGGPCDGCGVIYEAGSPVATACIRPDAWSL